MFCSCHRSSVADENDHDDENFTDSGNYKIILYYTGFICVGANKFSNSKNVILLTTVTRL